MAFRLKSIQVMIKQALIGFAFLLSWSAASAQESNQNSFPSWNFQFSSANLCARQSQEPARAVYLYFDGFGPGRAAIRWAQQLGRDPRVVMGQVWADFQKRSYFLARNILNALASQQLQVLKEDELQACGLDNCTSLEAKIRSRIQTLDAKLQTKKLVKIFRDEVKCMWVKKSLPQQLQIKTPNRKDIEKIALFHLDRHDYVDRCENLLSRETSNKADLVLRFEVPEIMNWKQNGFLFWSSFKYYLKEAWKHELAQENIQFQDLLKSFAIDELVTIVAEGCASVARPECGTDFMSQRQIQDLMKSGDFGKAFLMANEMVKKEGEVVRKLQTPQKQDTFEADRETDSRQFLMSATRIRHQAAQNLFEHLKRLNSILAQMTPEQLSKEASEQLSNDKSSYHVGKAETLCAEVQKFSEKEISGFAQEVMRAESLVARLQTENTPGQPIQVLWAQTLQTAKLLGPWCAQVEKEMKQRILSPKGESEDLDSVPALPWFNKITQYSLPLELQNRNASNSSSVMRTRVKLQNEVICHDAMDCNRRLFESAAEVYRVALYKAALLPGEARTYVKPESLGGAVSCKLFDPWAQSQSRKKKLVLDVVSSFLSGISRLPIYLDIGASVPQVTSFQQLVQNGQLTFDPVMKSNGLDLTVFVDLGILAKTPCLISISNKSQVKLQNSVYVFRGIEVKACGERVRGESQSDSVGITQVNQSAISGCGSCMLNFDQVLLATVQSDFALFRFGLRFIGAFVRYFQSTYEPNLSPISLEVNPQYAAEALKKYSEIPESCVFELVNGSKCMQDLCVSKTVVQFEQETGQTVESASLWSDESTVQKSVWVKVKGCSREYPIRVTCEERKAPSFISIPRSIRELKCAERN